MPRAVPRPSAFGGHLLLGCDLARLEAVECRLGERNLGARVGCEPLGVIDHAILDQRCIRLVEIGELDVSIALLPAAGVVPLVWRVPAEPGPGPTRLAAPRTPASGFRPGWVTVPRG